MLCNQIIKDSLEKVQTHQIPDNRVIDPPYKNSMEQRLVLNSF